jgi:hypothetical protein
MVDETPWTEEQTREWCRAFNKEHSTTWVEPVDAQERESLERFCELVDELEGYAIFKKLLHREQVEWNIKTQDNVVVAAAIKDLDEEHLRSFLLTVRMLYQSRDGCSVRQIAAIFKRRVGERNALWWNQFNPCHVGLNNFLDMRLEKSEQTNRELFEIFLYGQYAHRGHLLYKEWKKDTEVFIGRKGNFLLILATFFAHVRILHPFVKQLLAVKNDPYPI